jgi:hypothetical protein
MIVSGRSEGKYDEWRGNSVQAVVRKDRAILHEKVLAKSGKFPAWKLEEHPCVDKAHRNAAPNGRMAFEEFS